MWNNLKASIASIVRTNNNQEITGANLQGVLNTIVNSVGANATFAGVATPSTSPGTPDGPVFYIAAGKGIYPNFGNQTVTVGTATLGIFLWNGSVWSYIPVIISGVTSAMAALSYAVCSTKNSTAAKSVNISGYELIRGGSMKIKMQNANTAASNVTLNISSTGAIPLYYEGELASASNSWEAGEVLDVYYDGTNYYANSVAGGGKFNTGERVRELGIDVEPIPNSMNLVQSGGAFREVVEQTMAQFGGRFGVKNLTDISELKVDTSFYFDTIVDGVTQVIKKQGSSHYRIAYTKTILPKGTIIHFTGSVSTARGQIYGASAVLPPDPMEEGFEINNAYLARGSENFDDYYVMPYDGYFLYAFYNKDWSNRLFEVVAAEPYEGNIFSTGEKVNNTGIDASPVANSNCLVQSGGVYAFVNYGANTPIEPTSAPRINANISLSNIWQKNNNVYCRIIPITETGDYTITASNGLAAFAVLTTKTVTIGDTASYAPGYSLVNMDKGDSVTVNIASGLFLYVRDDNNQTSGRILPNITLIGQNNRCLRESDITDNLTNVSKIPTGQAVKDFIEIGGGMPIEPTSAPRINANISLSNIWQKNNNVYCRIIPITETGDYTITASNGLAAFAVLTTKTVTIGDTASYAPGYSLVNMDKGDSVTVNIASGLFLYVRDDNNQTSGRILPSILLGIANAVVRQSDLKGIGKKVIKCLFIGNSVNQDHIGYLPWLLRNAYGDTIDFTIAIAYKASYTIKGYVEDIMSGNVNLDIFSIANNSESWTNYNNYPFANIWANFGNFDLISFEGYFNHGTPSAGMVEDVTYFNPFIDNLIAVNTTPFKVGYLMHQTYNYTTHTEEEAWERIVNGAKYAISDTPVSILFPCGAVTKIVNGEIPQSMLTNDNIHNQQGLPCIMGAYVVMEELSRYYGLISRIIGNHSRITTTAEEALNIPGKNGTLQVGTDSQYVLCQKAAIKAVKWGDYLVINNSNEL